LLQFRIEEDTIDNRDAGGNPVANRMTIPNGRVSSEIDRMRGVGESIGTAITYWYPDNFNLMRESERSSG
jgi:hypothetical protein